MQRHRLICAACLLWTVVALGGEPPTDPILRIDAGMHTAPIYEISVRRIEGIKSAVLWLAYSPDGHYFAATLGGNEGVRVYKADTGELIAQDTDYDGDSFGADFSSDGRLVTSTYNGYVRVYHLDKSGLHLAAKMAAPGGQKDYHLRFSPDGRLIAVGYDDSVRVSVLDSVTLALRYAPQSPGSGSLRAVAWSFDGQFLYAAGVLKGPDGYVMRRWPQRQTITDVH